MLQKIEDFVLALFALKWAPFHSETAFDDPSLRYPGVYLLAHSATNLEGAAVNPSDVFYIGMSNNAQGVRIRLNDFKRGLESGETHSGAMRFFRDFAQNRPFSELTDGKKFYFVCKTVECNSRKLDATPDDWRCMGEVECAEKYAMARVRDLTGELPLLNKQVERKK